MSSTRIIINGYYITTDLRGMLNLAAVWEAIHCYREYRSQRETIARAISAEWESVRLSLVDTFDVDFVTFLSHVPSFCKSKHSDKNWSGRPWDFLEFPQVEWLASGLFRSRRWWELRIVDNLLRYYLCSHRDVPVYNQRCVSSKNSSSIVHCDCSHNAWFAPEICTIKIHFVTDSVARREVGTTASRSKMRTAVGEMLWKETSF